MPKPAIARVAWDTQDASYLIQEKTERGMTIPLKDFESAAWQEWLAQRSSFAFQSKHGHRLTARKETRARGGTYWVAYRKIGGKLTHTYLGRSEDLSSPAWSRSLTPSQSQGAREPGWRQAHAPTRRSSICSMRHPARRDGRSTCWPPNSLCRWLPTP